MKLTEVKLKDISKNNRGYYGIGAPAVDYDKNKYTYLRITDINDDGTLNKTALKSVDAENAFEFLLKKNDIVFARTGASTGRNYFYDGEINNLVFAGFLIKFSLDEEKVNPRFIKYYCLSQNYKNWITSSLTGSTRPNINEKQLSEMPVFLPDRQYQNRAAKVLDTITRKIELNNQINNNLLELIKTLYIEKIKNNNDINFEEKTLDEFCNIFTGKKNANASEENGQYKFFTCAPEPLSINSYIYDGPAVIVAGNGAYTGRTNFYNGKFDLYQRTYGITTNNDYIYLFYAMIYTDLQNAIMGGTHGSAIPYIVMNDIAKFKVKYNKELFDELSQEIKVLLLKIKSNEVQNETLEQLRDTLLPKLMNGEIDLDKIEI